MRGNGPGGFADVEEGGKRLRQLVEDVDVVLRVRVVLLEGFVAVVELGL